MSRGGYVKLHRTLAEHALWLKDPMTPGQFFAHLVLTANYRDTRVPWGNAWLEIRRGQVYTSILALAATAKRDAKTVSSWLKLLKADGMIEVESKAGVSGGYTIVTLVNYEKFQGQDSLADSRADSLADSRADSLADSLADSGSSGERNGVRAPVRTGERPPDIREVLKTGKKHKALKNGAAAAPVLSATGSDPFEGIEPGRTRLP